MHVSFLLLSEAVVGRLCTFSNIYLSETSDVFNRQGLDQPLKPSDPTGPLGRDKKFQGCHIDKILGSTLGFPLFWQEKTFFAS